MAKKKYQEILEQLQQRTKNATLVSMNDRNNVKFNNVNKNDSARNIKNMDDINNFANNGTYNSFNKQLNESLSVTADYKKKFAETAKKNNIYLGNNDELVPDLSAKAKNDLKKQSWEKGKILNTTNGLLEKNDSELNKDKETFNKVIGNTEEYEDYVYRTNKLNPLLKYSKDLNKVRENDSTVADKVIAPFLSGLDNINNLGNVGAFKTDNGYINLPTLNDLKASKAVETTNNGLYEMYANVTESIGNMVPSIATNAIAPGAGSVLFAASTFNEARNQALTDGYDERQSSAYALVNTVLETSLGSALGGIPQLFGKSALSTTIGDFLGKTVIKNPVMTELVADAISEFGEEYLQEWLDPIMQSYILEHKDFMTSLNSSNFFDVANFKAGFAGAISSILLNGPSAIKQSKKLKYDFDSIVKSIETETDVKLTDEQIKELQKSYYDSIAKGEELIYKSLAARNEINNNVNSNIDANESQSVDTNIEIPESNIKSSTKENNGNTETNVDATADLETSQENKKSLINNETKIEGDIETPNVSQEEVDNAYKKFYTAKEKYGLNDEVKELQKEYNRLKANYYQQTNLEEIQTKTKEPSKIKELEKNKDSKEYKEYLNNKISKEQNDYIERNVSYIQKMLENNDIIDDAHLNEIIYNSPEYEKNFIAEDADTTMSYDEINKHNKKLYNKVYEKLVSAMQKEGISRHYDNSKGTNVYDMQELAKNGYNDKIKEVLSNKDIAPDKNVRKIKENYQNLTSQLKEATKTINDLKKDIAPIKENIQDVTKSLAEANEVLAPLREQLSKNAKYSFTNTANSIEEKINKLRESADFYGFNNSTESQSAMNAIEKIISDKGYNVVFDENVKNSVGQSVDGLITSNNGQVEIKLNPNSNRYVEFLITHEVTHAIETKEMANLITDYASKNAEFNNALEDLKRTYGTNEVTSEIVADISGQLFGTQEFINNLSVEKPNIFKRIYNAIISLANKFTGNSKYDLFVKDLKNKWEEAYRNATTEQAIENLNLTNKYHLSANALNEVIDAVYNSNTNKDSMVKLRDFTPKQLVNLGVKDLPMLVRKGHLRENILTIAEARSRGLNAKRKHYHGLGVNTYMKAIDSLDNPIAVYRYTNTGLYSADNFIALTSVKDKLNNNIIVPIEINRKGQYNNIEIDTNRIKTTYGKGNSNYFNNKVKNGELTIVYTKKGRAKPPVQSGGLSPSTANNITQLSTNVNSKSTTSSQNNAPAKSNTKYSMQIAQNNAQELNNSSFSLEQRVSGDELLNAKDLIKEIKSVGAKVDVNGYVTLYHQTTNENADRIRQSGKMIAKEPYVYFSTSENASQSDGRGNTKLEFKIPAEKLTLDDIFEDNADVKIKLDGSKELDISSYLVNDEINIDSLKEKQLKIIKNNNPVNDDYHTWIRNIEDIKTLEETINDSDWIDYDEYNPDLSRQDIENAIDSGKIIVYSSYPIKQGIFVSPSKMEAENYSRNGKVYSKEVDISDVAWIDPTQGQYAKTYDASAKKYSQDISNWNEYVEKNFPSTGTRTRTKDMFGNIGNNLSNDIAPVRNNKIADPIQIANITKEDASTTPALTTKKYNYNNNGESHFAKNIDEKTNMLTREQKDTILASDDVKYYDKITNKDSLAEAKQRLEKNGAVETTSWFNKDNKTATATDVAEGWILLKQYADNGQTKEMVEVAKKMRDIGTKAGQTIQAFNIMQRLTPEGMVAYAQSELQEAYDNIVKNKSLDWINDNRSKFDLTGEETAKIMNIMEKVKGMEDGYEKNVELAKIQKLVSDKLPSNIGNKVKSWSRISMLFNPKTQVRNVVGNALIVPVNMVSDGFATLADKYIASKTGMRTTGLPNVNAMLKGIKEGAYQATNDYKLGINTKNMNGNRFEISNGKSFNDNKLLGKSLNNTEALLNYVMDVGDRVFSQSSFENSLQNQMILNNTTEITKDMVDIATQESLSRTWNDNNNYTKFVLNVRKGLNDFIGVEGYGLGDVLIPFAKTPANLTKAIVDYSPAGLIKVLNEGINLTKSLNNGQYDVKMQHRFVQDLGKATAGTMLYVLGYALAKTGIASGDSDDDKDVASFIKNALGINSYSIKIGDKSFTYDWAQPIAAPIATMANIVNSNDKGKALLEGIVSSLDSAGSILLEQSFLQSINDVLTDNDGIVSGIINEVLDLPARAVPTFSKQIADLIDGTQRATYEKDKPLETALNKIKVKIPFLSQQLAPIVDTLGNNVKKYGGNNSAFNIFLNPANINSQNLSTAGKEIYDIYQATGEKSVMPVSAPYSTSIKVNGETTKVNLDSRTRAEYQTTSGDIVEEEVNKLLKSSSYKKMTDSDKAEVLKNIANYANYRAKVEVLGADSNNTYSKAEEYVNAGGNISDYYTFKQSIDDTNSSSKKKSIVNYLINSGLNDELIGTLYQGYYSNSSTINFIVNSGISMKEFIKYDSQEFESDYNSKGVISGSRQAKVIKYINSLNLNVAQKAMLIKMKYNSYDTYNGQIFSYINNLNYTKFEKASMLKQVGFDDFDNYLVSSVNAMSLSSSDKEKILKELGFTIRNGMVYK
nr:MAG TPA: ATPase [Caudoviricetes sp.]